MGERINSIIEYVQDASTDFNLGKEKYWGIFFMKKNNGICAIAMSRWFVVEFENIGEEPEDEFYNFCYKRWSKNIFPYTPEEFQMTFENRLHIMGKFTVPLGTVINHIKQIDEEKSNENKKYSRIIFSKYDLQKNAIVANFNLHDGILEHRSLNAAIKKPFRVDINSHIPINRIIPGRQYTCEFVREVEDAYLLNCIEPCGILRMGIKHSPEGFIPHNMHEINKLVGIPPELILGIDLLDPINVDFQPIHFHCLMFYHLIKIFAILGTEHVDVFFGPDPLEEDPLTKKLQTGIIMQNVKRTKDEPRIRIIMQSLNLDYGPQFC